MKVPDVIVDRAYRLKLLGAFRLSDPEGRKIDLRSKKAIALLGLLATADTGERTRLWLQSKLWGTREPRQAQTSLRRELYNIRQLTSDAGVELFESDARMIRLNLDHVVVDIRDRATPLAPGELLEGIDMPGEEAFQTWLREARSALAAETTRPGAARTAPVPAPRRDISAAGIASLLLLPIETALDDAAHVEVRRALGRIMAARFSRSRWFPVSVWQGTAGKSVQSHDLDEVLAGAGATYGLITRVTVREGEAELSSALIRRPGARLIWTERTRLPADPGAADFHTIVQRFANVIIELVAQEEVQQALACGDEDLTLAGLIWRARHYLQSASQEGVTEARKYIDRVMAIHPHLAEIVILDSMQKIMTYLQGTGEIDVPRLRALAERAIRADPNDARGPLTAAMVELLAGNLDLAIGHAMTAIQISPGFLFSYDYLALALIQDGRFEEAEKFIEDKLAIAPSAWREYHSMMLVGLARTMRGQHAQALEHCERALIVKNDYPLSILVKIHALVQLGRTDKAAEAYRRLDRQQIETLDATIDRLWFRDQRLREDLRKSVAAAAKAAGSRTDAMHERPA